MNHAHVLLSARAAVEDEDDLEPDDGFYEGDEPGEDGFSDNGDFYPGEDEEQGFDEDDFEPNEDNPGPPAPPDGLVVIDVPSETTEIRADAD